MSPAFRSCRLTIASERVMELTPLERACHGSESGHCSGRTSPQEITLVRDTRMPYVSDHHILPLAVMSITRSLLPPAPQRRAGTVAVHSPVDNGPRTRSLRGQSWAERCPERPGRLAAEGVRWHGARLDDWRIAAARCNMDRANVSRTPENGRLASVFQHVDGYRLSSGPVLGISSLRRNPAI